jgi:hypothetical protein
VIPSLPAILWAVLMAHARDESAEDPPPAEAAPDEQPAGEPEDAAGPDDADSPAHSDPIARYRTGFDVLADRAIGTTSRPVEFNWRTSPAHLAASGSFLFELNNFDSVRGGAMARLPTGGLLLELGLSYVGVWNTPSSRQLSLTPYRQPGRPDRLELDVTVGLPLAEGVVTTAPRFFPAVQMVFVAYAGVRYLVYPTGFAHMKPGQVGGAIFSPTLTEIELDNLEDRRLAAMQVDLGRYGLMLGLGNDLYFKSGVFLSPRMMLAVPLLAPATQTELRLWADLSLAVGVAL